MKNKNKIAQIIESVSDELKIKLLSIKFPSENDTKALFTPNLENIGFNIKDNTVTVNLKNTSFIEQFNEWTDRFIEKISSDDTSEILIDKFNREIKAIVLLGKKEKNLSMIAARGLYGELLVLKSHLEDKKISQDKILEGWHRPAPANHDFDYEDHTIEVKTVSRTKTTTQITSEDQLTAVDGKHHKLKLFRIESVSKSQTDSLGNLYDEIKSILDSGLKLNFELKCAEDVKSSYLGPECDPLKYKFTVIDEFLYDIDQISFPRIKKENLDQGISKVSYDLDISAIENFKI